MAFGAIPESRHADPVILVGEQAHDLLGIDPEKLVGFRYDDTVGGWEQVPVQVDEKHYQDWLVVKQGDCQ